MRNHWTSFAAAAESCLTRQRSRVGSRRAQRMLAAAALLAVAWAGLATAFTFATSGGEKTGGVCSETCSTPATDRVVLALTTTRAAWEVAR
jgi:hypothetical protein